MERMMKYPLFLSPAGKNYLWGGERLKTEYGKKIDLEPLAETWECSAHPDGPSVVVNGEYRGKTLIEVINEHPEYLGTKCNQNEGFPILIKFIDAAKDLSVQVHPDDEYAKEHEGDRGKTEMWYVLDAKDGAELVYGFEHLVDEQMLRDAVETGDLSKHLHKVRVHKGDMFYIPAGTVHAIGAGILLAEIQESSNLTYRVYDYDRIGADGKKRELHFDKAVNVMDMQPSGTIRQKSRVVRYYPGCSREIICRCQYFEAERIQCSGSFEFTVRPESYQVVLCIEGKGILGETEFAKGQCIMLPAGLGRKKIIGQCELIKVRC